MIIIKGNNGTQRTSLSRARHDRWSTMHRNKFQNRASHITNTTVSNTSNAFLLYELERYYAKRVAVTLSLSHRISHSLCVAVRVPVAATKDFDYLRSFHCKSITGLTHKRFIFSIAKIVCPCYNLFVREEHQWKRVLFFESKQISWWSYGIRLCSSISKKKKRSL